MTSAELADRLGFPFSGVPVDLRGASALESATGADLSFVVAPKSFPAARASLAGCILAPDTYQPTGEQSVIWAAEPRASFSLALALLYPPRPLLPGVHASTSVAHNVAIAATAEIGPNCTLDAGTVVGPDTRIGPGCHIGAGVHIGSNCVLHTAVQLYPGTRLGDRVILHSGCVLGADGFGFTRQPEGWVKFPQVGHVEIGDDVEIGANSCVDRGALGPTVINAGTKLDNLVHIGHNCQIGRHVVIAAQTGLSGGVVVGDNAVIGGQVGIGDKVRIEPGAILGSGSGVLTSKIVRAGAGPLWGTPARPLRQYLAQLAALTRVSALRQEMREIRKALDELKSSSFRGGAS